MRLGFLAAERQWTASKERGAPDFLADEAAYLDALAAAAAEGAEEEEEARAQHDMLVDATDRPVFSSQPGTALPASSATYSSQRSVPDSHNDACEREAQEMQRREAEEMEALIAMMEEPEAPARLGEEPASSHYGSDDEDYDALFMDLADEDAMDVSG
jgi:hypothetical protein